MGLINKIYGVYGLMDYQAVLKVGRCVMRVHFTGGDYYRPATFMTSDAFTQRIIEESENFKKGQIQLIRGGESRKAASISAPKPLAPDGPTPGPSPQGEGGAETDLSSSPARDGDENGLTAGACEVAAMEEAEETETSAPDDKPLTDDKPTELAEKAKEEAKEKAAEENEAEEVTAEEEAQDNIKEETKETAGLKEVKVSCLQDARDYLEINFGVKSSKVRLRTQIEEVGKANGVAFIFPEGA